MVVTIVVLLILAGVSINLVLSNSGIISRANEAKEKYGEAKANEESDLESAVDLIDEQATGQVSLAKVPVGTKANKNGTINGEAGSSNNPVIPKGYIPIDTATSSWGDGSSAPTQESVDHGLVIKDESGNEWVWVPVENVKDMYEAEDTEEYTLCGTTGDTAVKTKLYSKSGIISGQTRTTPGTTSSPYYREPDLVVGSDGASYDAKEEYYKTILGFNSTKDMAEAFVADYEEMIKSVKTYGGFYIGRYELSEEGVQKDKATLTNTNWYNSYKKCKELNASEKVETRMIWGCQWDVACNYIANKGDKKSITDSSTWGNYSNYNTANSYTEGEEGYEAGAGSKQNTGSSENWKANNIYDLAGNYWEWTQEGDFDSRISRGCYYGDFNGNSVGKKIYCAPNSSWIANSGYDLPQSTDGNARHSSHFNNKVALSKNTFYDILKIYQRGIFFIFVIKT